MREYLNGILEFIGAESLTDEEFGSIGDLDIGVPTDVYRSLFEVMESREVVSDMIIRLQNYFLAQGQPVVPVSHTPVSNIFIGSPLE